MFVVGNHYSLLTTISLIASMKTTKATARVFGVFFLLSFISYALGNGLIETLLASSDVLSSVYANKMQFICGAVLMSVVHTFFNIGLIVAMHSVIQSYNAPVSYAYLGSALTATIMLIVGAVFLLLLLPLSDEYIRAGSANANYLQTLSLICKKGNFFSYQIGMTIWGMGGLVLCYALYQFQLVPRLMSIWGIIGYIIFITGTIAELLGYSVGVLLSMPGGLFEIALSIWLIIKGFTINIQNEVSLQ
jgi:Domain of unknown function (DUF4386)